MDAPAVIPAAPAAPAPAALRCTPGFGRALAGVLGETRSAGGPGDARAASAAGTGPAPDGAAPDRAATGRAVGGGAARGDGADGDAVRGGRAHEDATAAGAAALLGIGLPAATLAPAGGSVPAAAPGAVEEAVLADGAQAAGGDRALADLATPTGEADLAEPAPAAAEQDAAPAADLAAPGPPGAQEPAAAGAGGRAGAPDAAPAGASRRFAGVAGQPAEAAPAVDAGSAAGAPAAVDGLHEAEPRPAPAMGERSELRGGGGPAEVVGAPPAGAPGAAADAGAGGAQAGEAAGAASRELVERITAALDRMAAASSPRRLVVEAGEMRLAVALHGDAVRVTVLRGEETGWSGDLGRALASRGLTLSTGAGSAGEGREGRSRSDEGVPAPPARSTRTSTARSPRPGWIAGTRL